MGQIIILFPQGEGDLSIRVTISPSPIFHGSLPVTLDQFKRTSVQLLEVSGGKTWMLLLSDYRPNKVNMTVFRIKQSFKTSLAALLPPPE